MSLPDATHAAALSEPVIKPVWFAWLDIAGDPVEQLIRRTRHTGSVAVSCLPHFFVIIAANQCCAPDVPCIDEQAAVADLPKVFRGARTGKFETHNLGREILLAKIARHHVNQIGLQLFIQK